MPQETVTLEVSHSDMPSTRDYVLQEKVPSDAQGQYLVDAQKDPRSFAAVNVLANLQTGLDAFLEHCDADKVPPTWWPGGPQQLPIYPYDLQGERNAFFTPVPFHTPDGRSFEPGVHCGVFVDVRSGSPVFTAASGEFLGHEGGPGHALLHRFRPHYMRSKAPEVRAYHESFGDVSTLLTQLQFPSVLELVVGQTGGDLSRPNAVSDFGEQFGASVNYEIASKVGIQNFTGGNYLRTALHDLHWQDPMTLPPVAQQPGQLSRDAHSFGRIWTGAIYSILQNMVRERMNSGLDARGAIASASEDLLKVYAKLTSETSPQGDFRFQDMARALLAADELAGTELGPTIQAEMERRKIL